MRKSYVYKISCLVTGEYYFGSSFNAKRDSYWGSGRKIRERIAQYGKENFIKEILGEFDDRVEAHKKENYYIEKFRNDEKCLNIHLDHHFDTYSDETVEKRSASNTGKHRTEETRAKMSAVNRGDKNPMYGKIFSEEHRSKLSAALRGNTNSLGKHLSEEHRSKISAAMRGKPQQHKKHWRKNPITGKREWYD